MELIKHATVFTNTKKQMPVQNGAPLFSAFTETKKTIVDITINNKK